MSSPPLRATSKATERAPSQDRTQRFVQTNPRKAKEHDGANGKTEFPHW
jgi:hypothetical protein